MGLKPIVSESRTYVALCNKSNFDGYYFRKFVLPECDPLVPTYKYNNDSHAAAWHFLNRMNSFACIEFCFPIEDYQDLTEEKER